MNNTVNNVSTTDAVIKEKVLESNTQPFKPTDKEIIDQLIKQAKFAEDHYRKLVSQFEENLKKVLPRVF